MIEPRYILKVPVVVVRYTLHDIEPRPSTAGYRPVPTVPHTAVKVPRVKAFPAKEEWDESLVVWEGERREEDKTV